jgi:hypothetical protein
MLRIHRAARVRGCRGCQRLRSGSGLVWGPTDGPNCCHFTRSILDRGGWENTVMTNSHYTATNPLLAVGVGSGATSPMPASMMATDQLAQLQFWSLTRQSHFRACFLS